MKFTFAGTFTGRKTCSVQYQVIEMAVEWQTRPLRGKLLETRQKILSDLRRRIN
jgi:hypothetical protein